jgi:polygalacturonase
MKLWIVTTIALAGTAAAQPVFNIKDYGASGRKSDNARPALQQAIDACGKAGGGTRAIALAVGSSLVRGSRRHHLRLPQWARIRF